LTTGQIMVFAKLRHCDVKNALLAPWSLKTNAAHVVFGKYLENG